MKKCSFFFINYYDLQRFGLPNKPRVTHLVGKNLLQENYKQAFDFLKELGGSTGEKATLFQDPPQSFFDRLECREKCFYKNSYSSYLWNQELFDQIALMGGDYTSTYEYEGILYCFSHSQNILHKVIQNAAELPIIRYFSDGQQELSKESSRTTIIQTCIRVTDTTEDEYHPNKWKNVVEFFLPSGCYATMLVKQLISSIQSS
jgi:tRNA pseudouridine13 synthase